MGEEEEQEGSGGVGEEKVVEKWGRRKFEDGEMGEDEGSGGEGRANGRSKEEEDSG